MAELQIPLARAWNTWNSEYPAQISFPPLGLSITPCAYAASRAAFTRFMTPASADAAAGSWQRYYRRWSSVTLAEMDPDLLELVPGLAGFAPPAEVCDKTTYSAFESPAFVASLRRRKARTLIFCGIETDVCVLASVLGAIDHGYHVVLATDALASSSDATHRAVLDLLVPRLDQQIEEVPVASILSCWTSPC